MILVDFSGVFIAACLSQNKENRNKDFLRHMTLSMIRSYRTKYGKKYGNPVICCDAGNTWRRQFFPNYKQGRDKKRKESDVDWDSLYSVMNTMIEEIREELPFPVIRIEECEADDIIGELSRYTNTFGNHEPVLIISSDKDFIQLQKYDNVRQYSPARESFLDDDNPKAYLISHILRGDGGDAIPNALSDDNVFVEGRRQTVMSQKRFNAILAGEMPEANHGIERNTTLVDLSRTPKRLKTKIINSYEDQLKEIENTEYDIVKYFQEKQCINLLEHAQDFL